MLTKLSTQPIEVRDDGEINLIYPHDNTPIYLPTSLLETGQHNEVNVYINGIRCDSDPYHRLYDENVIGLTPEALKGATWDKVKAVFTTGMYRDYTNASSLRKTLVDSDLMFKGMSFEETRKYLFFIDAHYGNEWYEAVTRLNLAPTIQNLTTLHTPLGYKELFSLYGKEELYNENLDLLEIKEEVELLNPDKSFFITKKTIRLVDETDTTLHGDFEYYSNGGVARC